MKTPKLDLTLLIPGFLRPELALSCPLHKLERMLSRADHHKLSGTALEQRLFELFNIPFTDGQQLPVAPITYALDSGEASNDYWLRADPVYCQADRDKVVMLSHELGLAQDEARQMVTDLNRLFKEDGWQFFAPTPDRWYLKMPEASQLQTTLLSQAMGRDIHRLLPQSPQATVLHRAMSEMEMLLHSNFANQQRLANRQLPVTNLWLWGGGRMPAKPEECQWAQVWSDDALALGLAKLARVSRCSAPGSLQQWLGQVVTPGNHLVVLPQAGDGHALNEHWFAPLLPAIKSGRLNSVGLWLGSNTRYHITRRNLGRWWRRNRTMKGFL